VILSAILIIVALILINAVYVGAEFAAVGVRRSRIQQLASEGNPLAAWLLPLIESPAALDRYIAACQIGITLSSLVLGAYAQRTIAVWLAPLFGRLGGLQDVAAQSTSAVAVLLVLTAAQVIFAELIPKSLALQYPTQAALYTLLPMVPSLWLYKPFIKWLNGTGLLLLRLLGSPSPTHGHIHSPDEIGLLMAESRDGGLLEPDEHRRLQRALRLSLRQAKQLMVPRPRISALDIKTLLAAARLSQLDRRRRRHAAHEGPCPLASQRRARGHARAVAAADCQRARERDGGSRAARVAAAALASGARG
jgi:putative hemolysin